MRQKVVQRADADHGATPLHALCEAHTTLDEGLPGNNVNNVDSWRYAAEMATRNVHEGDFRRLAAVVREAGLPDGPASACLLVASGASARAAAANGSTPLHWAAGVGALGMVRFLLQCGGDPLARSYTWRR